MKAKNAPLSGGSRTGGANELFVKLKSADYVRNPVMFTVDRYVRHADIINVWIMSGEKTQGSLLHTILIVFAVAFQPSFLPNFAEAIAEARGKAQARFAENTRQETPAKWIQTVGEMCISNEIKIVPSSQLRKGHIFLCETGDIIPTDGEIIGRPSRRSTKVPLPVNRPR